MSKKERIRLLIGIVVITLFFCAIASIGWTKDEFVITYFYGFDGKYETQVVNKGYVREPLDPGRYGHIFDGWYYTDKQGNEILFDFNVDPITNNLELFAHWKPLETEVVLNLSGGECEVDYITVKYGEEYTLPIPSKKGYHFVGWSNYSTEIFSQSGIWSSPYAQIQMIACWSKVNYGRTIELGRYKQDTSNVNGNDIIEWLVIDRCDGKYLLVSKYCLDALPLNSEGGYTKWADCSLRSWLNTAFYNSAFSDNEKSYIVETIDNELGTIDNVFLLSVDESKLLFGYDLYGEGTEYAMNAGLNNSLATQNGYAAWWLRSDNNCHRIGSAYGYGNFATEKLGVRPAIWIDAEKLLKKN